MAETAHLIIVNRQLKDIAMEEVYLNLYPEIGILDPPVGESRNPTLYSVFIKENNLHIGFCCLYNLTITSIELGIRIFNPDYWGKGYGGEILNMLCKHAFSNFPWITAVLAKTPVYNTRAIRCYEKCGFVQTSHAILDGYDMVFMAKRRHNSDDNFTAI